ncbi:glycoside hydrolase family 15 protein [Nostoc sp. UIC 10890]
MYHNSISLLLAHEDKTYPGALIASMAIPWGEAKDDQDQGGYHLVWTRDLVSSVSGLVAAGETDTAVRSQLPNSQSQQSDTCGGLRQRLFNSAVRVQRCKLGVQRWNDAIVDTQDRTLPQCNS